MTFTCSLDSLVLFREGLFSPLSRWFTSCKSFGRFLCLNNAIMLAIIGLSNRI